MNKLSSAVRSAATGWSNIEAVDKERAIFTGPGWQRSRQQTGQSAEPAARSPWRQAQR